MTDKIPVVDDQADAVFAEQSHADFEQGDAVVGVGIAVAVVEQLPAQRYVDSARSDGNEQDIDLARVEILFRAVQVQAQFALRGQ